MDDQLWSVSIPVEPIRTRIRFLGVLNAAERKAFLESARAELLTQINEAEAKAENFDKIKEPFRFLMPRGVVMMAKARLAWIDEAL